MSVGDLVKIFRTYLFYLPSSSEIKADKEGNPANFKCEEVKHDDALGRYYLEQGYPAERLRIISGQYLHGPEPREIKETHFGETFKSYDYHMQASLCGLFHLLQNALKNGRKSDFTKFTDLETANRKLFVMRRIFAYER